MYNVLCLSEIIINLFSGTYYKFEIFTVNENFMSIRGAMTVCKTLDKGI